MNKKAFIAGGILLCVVAAVFFYRQANQPAPFVSQGEASGSEHKKIAILRLEDVSPGGYDTEDKLGKLRAIADYLYKEGVPFHVSMIPVYKDPRSNVEINIGDTGNPHVRDFIETIKYMQDKGGLVGLHGFTHQYQSEVTGSGFEFMEKGQTQYAQPAFAEERVKKALELAEKAGIRIDYWETPHYTATLDQYRVIANYFGLIYDPNPREKNLKNISFWDGAGPDSQSVIFVPAPLLNITGEKDVSRILIQLDKNDPALLPSFFYHPYLEFKSMYKMKTPEGKEFYVHETDSYLHRLINGFKDRDYKFVTVYDMISFLPAQRMSGILPTTGNVLLDGDFDGDGRADFVAGDLAAGRWMVVRSLIDRAIPRNRAQSFSPAIEWLNNWGQGGTKEFAVGDFNGDGRKDLVCWDRNTKEIQVAVSDGGKFIPSQHPWGKFAAPEGTVRMLTGDFNGDGKDDLLFWSQGENKVYVAHSNGTKFSNAAVWLENWARGRDLRVLASDFNGDGKKDFAVLDTEAGAVQVALSNGARFISPGNDGDQIWIKDFAVGGGWQVLAGDFNGDGFDDLAAYDSASGRWQFARSTGKRFLLKSWSVTYGKDQDGHALTGDFNGDRKVDLAVDRHFDKGQAVIDIALSVLNNKK